MHPAPTATAPISRPCSLILLPADLASADSSIVRTIRVRFITRNWVTQWVPWIELKFPTWVLVFKRAHLGRVVAPPQGIRPQQLHRKAFQL